MKNFKITKRNFVKNAAKLTGSLFILSKIGGILSPTNANASTPEIIIGNREKITPLIESEGHPSFFASTNNLRRKAGSPFLAKGHFLSIEGYVTDLVDVPIENVIIKIWQTNHFGYYQHLVDPENIDKFDQDFLGCGKTVTDNLGYYSFLTIDPGFYGDRAPHIHFMLQYDAYNDGKPVEVQMFFPEHPLNDKDPKYKLLTQNQQRLSTCALESIDPNQPIAAKRALFNIKFDLLHPVKRY